MDGADRADGARPEIRGAEVVLPAADLDATVAFFTEEFGFRVDAVIPADDPVEVVVSGHGLRVRLSRDGSGDPGVVRLLCDDARGERVRVAPNGTRVELVPALPQLELPELAPSFVVTRAADAVWVTGRAGMRYRDLIPDRQGGRFVASEIEITDGGEVPDYVHFHDVRFQLIVCRSGWVRVVYEDQGAPFVLQAGDCVLQPPGIRHRVLEASAGLRVIEISCPASHPTFADHDLALPTAQIRSAREFAGQRFVRMQAEDSAWEPLSGAGLALRDLGLHTATRGLAAGRVVRAQGAAGWDCGAHAAELCLRFVLRGAATLTSEGRDPVPLAEGDACVVPAGEEHAFTACSADLELLDVVVGLPA